MGWYTEYKIILSVPIVDFDYDFVDDWCSQQDEYIDINYMRHQYKNPLSVYVTIKYGRHEIDCVLEMLHEKFHCSGVVTIISTDVYEWRDWKKYYDSGEDSCTEDD